MGWIGFADRCDNRFDLRGLDAPPSDQPQSVNPEDLLPRGTLMIETRLSPEARPQTLLAFSRTFPWHSSFSLQALPEGGFVLIESQGDTLRHTTLAHDIDSRMDIVRLTYSWDAPAKWAQLALEQAGSIKVLKSETARPHPMPLADLKTMLTDPHQRTVTDDVVVISLSDEVEALGPMPGLTGNAQVATPSGERAVAHVRRGDLVKTEAGEIVPVLHAISRTVPTRGSFRPVRLRAPYFGLTRDTVVAPHQRIVICGSQVEYMFGKEAVLVPAKHLINGVSAFHMDGPDLMTYHQLLLPGHEVLKVAGCPMESLYIGRLRRKADELAASLLARLDRNSLPEHPQPAWQVLKPFEAVTLAMSHAA